MSDSLAHDNPALTPAMINTAELFEWGWRPFIGWGLGVALIWQVLIAPVITFMVNLFGYHPALPALNSDWISAVLIPMLGLSAMHSFDKFQTVKNSGS